MLYLSKGFGRTQPGEGEMTEQQVMTVEEVASYLRLNKQTVTRMAARGELPAVKVGRHWRFRIRKEYIDAKFDEEMKKKLCEQ
jgi:excisionase family DNA binding protein